MNLQEIHPLDSKLLSVRALQAALDALPPQAGEVCRAYARFPWWAFMATRMTQFATIVQEGITEVAGVRTDGGNVFMRITTTRAQYRATVTRGRLRVC